MLEDIILLDNMILLSVIVLVLLDVNNDNVVLINDTTKLSEGDVTVETICNCFNINVCVSCTSISCIFVILQSSPNLLSLQIHFAVQRVLCSVHVGIILDDDISKNVHLPLLEQSPRHVFKAIEAIVIGTQAVLGWSLLPIWLLIQLPQV